MPFVVTIVADLLFCVYMLLDPGAWLASFMQLTKMSPDFKLFILFLALGGFICAWVSEMYLLRLVRIVSKTRDNLWPHRIKTRKQYKKILEDMRI